MRSKFCRISGVLLCLIATVPIGGAAETAQEQTFDLKEISVFDTPESILRYLVRGAGCSCRFEPIAGSATGFPEFKSDKPVYGSFHVQNLAGRPDGKAGSYGIAIDESGGTGTGYDRLYYDADLDGDLTNDPPLKALQTPPAGASQRWSSIEQQVCFETFPLQFDFGGEAPHTQEVMPRLILQKGNQVRLSFVATKAYTAQSIDVGGSRFDAYLGCGYSLGQPLNGRGSRFYLLSKEGTKPGWWGADSLGAYHLIGEHYYQFLPTAQGERVTARRYEGELGTFEVGKGDRHIKIAEMHGSLRSADASVAIGVLEETGWPQGAEATRVPVGDYYPAFLTVTYGNLSIKMSNNYHTDGADRRSGRKSVYGIKIRADEPCVFDFSNAPDVLFASPARNKSFKRGDKIDVKAVLLDSELDIMIRGLDKRALAGKKPISLDPKVLITRKNGENVAEGLMPFG